MTVLRFWAADHCVFVVVGRLERGVASDMLDSVDIGDKIQCETKNRAAYYARCLSYRRKRVRRTVSKGKFFLTRIE